MAMNAFNGHVLPGDVLLLFADERPKLVNLDPADAKADHHAVVQLGATASDPERKGATVPRSALVIRAVARMPRPSVRAARTAICLSRGRDVHGGSSPTCCGTDPKRDSGKIGRFGLYLSGG
jgi:hypothetical protein